MVVTWWLFHHPWDPLENISTSLHGPFRYGFNAFLCSLWTILYTLASHFVISYSHCVLAFSDLERCLGSTRIFISVSTSLFALISMHSYVPYGPMYPPLPATSSSLAPLIGLYFPILTDGWLLGIQLTVPSFSLHADVYPQLRRNGLLI